MSKRSFRAFILLCLIVNAISGSPQFQSGYKQHRHSRHASCPSCSRERPEALVSWITPPRNEYHDYEPEPEPWQNSQFLRSSSLFHPPLYNSNAYDRTLRSRGGQPIRESRGSYKRENPFTFEGNLDFDVAPPQTTTVHSMTSLVTPYKPRFAAPRDPVRNVYKKPSYYGPIKGHSEQPVPFNRYSIYDSTNDEPTFENMKKYVTTSKGPETKYRVIYKGDPYPEEYVQDEAPGIQYEQFPRMQFARRASPVGGVQMQKQNDFPQYQRRQPEESAIFYEPEVKHNPYNLPSDRNVYKMMQNVDRDGADVIGNSKRPEQIKEQERQEFKSLAVPQIDGNDEEEEARVMDEMSVQHDDQGHFDFGEKQEEEDVNMDSRQITESEMSLEEISTDDTSQSAEQITRSSPVVMQIPKKVTTSN